MANLLLIDDDPDLLPDQVRHVFPTPAHRVEVAHTGAEGLKRAAEFRPDVILLDLRLPDQSGLDVLRQLRQIDAHIPVVLVTVVRSADSAAGQCRVFRSWCQQEDGRRVHLAGTPVPTSMQDELVILAERLQQVVGKLHRLGLKFVYMISASDHHLRHAGSGGRENPCKPWGVVA